MYWRSLLTRLVRNSMPVWVVPRRGALGLFPLDRTEDMNLDIFIPRPASTRSASTDDAYTLPSNLTSDSLASNRSIGSSPSGLSSKSQSSSLVGIRCYERIGCYRIGCLRITGERRSVFGRATLVRAVGRHRAMGMLNFIHYIPAQRERYEELAL